MNRSIWGVLFLMVACGDDVVSVDAAVDTFRVCTADRECSDELFCNGVERCMPAGEAADARGCVGGVAPCSADECDEDSRSCEAGCDTDEDGDGRTTIACGGDDCDDNDAERFPGNPEICDADGHDEDCDPSTFGLRDADGDGAPDAACCNADGATNVCGTDCDDTRPGVHGALPETCDGLDNDCDGMVDESVQVDFYPDEDGDGYGAIGSTPIRACMAPAGTVPDATDCDDTASEVHPGAFDICDGSVDQDCDGTADNPSGGCSCMSGSSRPCPDAVGACAAGSQSCIGGTWTGCSINPIPEICDSQDNDCNGMTDEEVTPFTFYADTDGDGFGDARAPRGACTNSAPPGHVANNSDCYDEAANARPGQMTYYSTHRGDSSFDYNCDRVATPERGLGGCSYLRNSCVVNRGLVGSRGGAVPCGGTGREVESCSLRVFECTPNFSTRVITQRCR